MGIDGKQQSLIAATVTQALHHRDGRDRIAADAAELLGDRQSQDTEVGTFFPPCERKRLVGIALEEIIVELILRELDGRILQLALFVGQIKVHVEVLVICASGIRNSILYA